MDKFKRFLKKVKERVPIWVLLPTAALVALIVTIGFDTLLQVISIGIVLAILSWSYLSDVKARTDLATQQSDNTRIEQCCFFFRAVSCEFVCRDEIAHMYCLLKPRNIDMIQISRMGSYNSCPVYRFSYPRPHGAPELTEDDEWDFGNTLQLYTTSQLHNNPYAPIPAFHGNTPVLQIVSVSSNPRYINVDVAVMHNARCWEDFMRAQNSPPPSQNNDFSDWEL